MAAKSSITWRSKDTDEVQAVSSATPIPIRRATSAKRTAPSNAHPDDMQPPSAKGRGRELALAAASAALAPHGDYDDQDDDDDGGYMAATATNVQSQPLPPPSPITMRPAEGIYDHMQVFPPRVNVSTDTWANRLALPTRSPPVPAEPNQKAIARDLGYLNQYAIPSIDGRRFAIDPTTAEAQRLLNTLSPDFDRDMIEQYMNGWTDPRIRTMFLQHLTTLPTPALRRRVLDALVDYFRQSVAAFGPDWTEQRLHQRFDVSRTPRHMFAASVAFKLGVNVSQMLIESDESMRRAIETGLEERRMALQAIERLTLALNTLVEGTRSAIQTNGESARVLLDELLPALTLDPQQLTMVLQAQDEKFMRRIEMVNLDLASSATPSTADEVARRKRWATQGRDQYFLGIFSTLAEKIAALHPQVLEAVRALQRRRKEEPIVAASAAAAAPPATPNNSWLPKATSTEAQLIQSLRNALSDNLIPWLTTALQLMAGGAQAEPTSAMSSRTLLFLDKDVQARAASLYRDTQHAPSGGTGQLQIPVIHTTNQYNYYTVRPFLPGLYWRDAALVSVPYVDIADYNVDTDVTRARRREEDVTWGTFCNPQAATWQNVQLSFRNDARIDDLVTHMHTYMELLVEDATASPLPIAVVAGAAAAVAPPPALKDGNKLARAELRTVISLLNLLRTGENLTRFAQRIHNYLAHVRTLAVGVTEHLFAETLNAQQAWQASEQLMQRWQPELIFDIRFACLATLLRYQFVRTFISDISTAITREQARQLAQQQEDLERAQAKRARLAQDDFDHATTFERNSWSLQPENLGRVIYSTALDTAIGASADIVRMHFHKKFPDAPMQTANWIAPEESWGPDPLSFREVFAAMVANQWVVNYRPGLYVSRVQREEQIRKTRDFLSNLNRFTLTSNGKGAYYFVLRE